MPDEGRPVRQLVGEGQGQGQVGIEVNDPPRLVGDPPANGAEGRHPGKDQQAQADCARQHVGVGGQLQPQLVEETRSVGLGVAGHDQEGVQHQEADGPGPDPAMPPNQPVLADRALEQRDTADEEDHQEEQVGAGQAGELAGEDEQPSRRLQGPFGLGADPEQDDREQSKCGHPRPGLGHPSGGWRRDPTRWMAHYPMMAALPERSVAVT